MDDVPDAQAVESEKAVWDLKENRRISSRAHALTKLPKQNHGFGQMLQHVAAAEEVRTARIFDREVAADNLDATTPCGGSASWLARIIALAVIACAA